MEKESDEGAAIELDYTQSVQENAAHYYELAKALRKKREGLESAIAETKKEMEKAKKEQAKKPPVRVKRDKEWYEKFHWFFTSQGKLALGGRNAQQNDLAVKKHMDDADLFFHADIQGGSAVVLKNGQEAGEEELREVAQFAASFSNAWKNANAGVDVYAVGKAQLRKHASGGYVPTGAFAIEGERQWFRNTPLGLKTGIDNGRPVVLPAVSARKLDTEVLLYPSPAGKEKGELAKGLAKRLACDANELLQILPNGRTKVKV